MPHPGLKVATDRHFDGRLSGTCTCACLNKLGYRPCSFADIDGDFKMQLEDLAPLLLAPDKLVVKTINGNSVTGKDLLEYFKVLWYIRIV